MRLLNVHTLHLEEFFEKDIPRYYILSHRWGKGEVSFKDYSKQRNLDGPGYQKILDACAIAQKFTAYDNETVDYIWIDTCCIDKRSSAELSEAINSMFSWYKKAVTCFVYLADVEPLQENKAEAIVASEWFRRGWTLQELLAPDLHIFFDSAWGVLGHICPWSDGSARCCENPRICAVYFHRPNLLQQVSSVTGISEKYVQHFSAEYSLPSVAQRMSWASKRITTRVEDMAYCLMGIFKVNMPLLYGEGRKAFFRLQGEIVKQTTDQSIFAWRFPGIAPANYSLGMLAPEPTWFKDCGNVVFHQAWAGKEQRAFSITNNGLELVVCLKKPAVIISNVEAGTSDSEEDHRAATSDETSKILLDTGCSFGDTTHILELNCKHSPLTRMIGESTHVGRQTRGVRERRAAKKDKLLAPVLVPLASEEPWSSFSQPETKFRRLPSLSPDGQAYGRLEILPEKRIYIKAHTDIHDAMESPITRFQMPPLTFKDLKVVCWPD